MTGFIFFIPDKSDGNKKVLIFSLTQCGKRIFRMLRINEDEIKDNMSR
jgi:DNA-binding PadR family transcriptional regulator